MNRNGASSWLHANLAPPAYLRQATLIGIGPCATEGRPTNGRVPGWFRDRAFAIGLWRGEGASSRSALRTSSRVSVNVLSFRPLLARRKGRSSRARIFPRLYGRKVLQQTDGRLRLVFSAPRSIPAFPTPLRRVIGHHWPWHLARANGFSGEPMGRGRAASRVQPAIRAATPTSPDAVQPSPLEARSILWPGHLLVASLRNEIASLSREPTISGTALQFQKHLAAVLRNQINAKPHSQLPAAPIAALDSLQYWLDVMRAPHPTLPRKRRRIGWRRPGQQTELAASAGSTPPLTTNRSGGQFARPRAAQQSHAAVRSPSRLRIRILPRR
jgi:hypothetical protein